MIAAGADADTAEWRTAEAGFMKDWEHIQWYPCLISVTGFY